MGQKRLKQRIPGEKDPELGKRETWVRKGDRDGSGDELPIGERVRLSGKRPKLKSSLVEEEGMEVTK